MASIFRLSQNLNIPAITKANKRGCLTIVMENCLAMKHHYCETAPPYYSSLLGILNLIDSSISSKVLLFLGSMNRQV